MSRVEELLDRLITREGGFVNHPSDRGGPTKYGITKGTLEEYLGRKVDISEVVNLDLALAKEIYITKYLAAPRIDTLPEPLQEILFDMAVHHGPRRAVTMLQQVINMAGFGPVDEDGKIGPQTREAANKAWTEMNGYLINALVEQRVHFMESIVLNDPSQKVFMRGWLKRAESFRVEV